MSPVTIAALPCTTPSYEQHPPFWGMGCPGAILMLLGLLLAIAGWLAILKRHRNLVRNFRHPIPPLHKSLDIFYLSTPSN